MGVEGEVGPFILRELKGWTATLSEGHMRAKGNVRSEGAGGSRIAPTNGWRTGFGLLPPDEAGRLHDQLQLPALLVL